MKEPEAEAHEPMTETREEHAPFQTKQGRDTVTTATTQLVNKIHPDRRNRSKRLQQHL